MPTALSASPLANPETKSDSELATALNRAALRTQTTSDRSRLDKLMQSYQTDQQLKYLHLQAEVEVLLQQLQTLKQRRLASTMTEGDRP
ncbi:MAG: hypothetical protein SVX43_19620 [Cyanobacteriota bacterium]|nr:hypothetical protein [Cyanobacteriota bacterium]